MRCGCGRGCLVSASLPSSLHQQIGKRSLTSSGRSVGRLVKGRGQKAAAARCGGSEEGREGKGRDNEFARETRTVSALKTAVIYAHSIGARRSVDGAAAIKGRRWVSELED